MKTYLELPHMLPITVRSTEGDKLWIEQPGADEEDCTDQILVHKDQVRSIIEALQAYLADEAGKAPVTSRAP
jgi:hypothetical protein